MKILRYLCLGDRAINVYHPDYLQVKKMITQLNTSYELKAWAFEPEKSMFKPSQSYDPPDLLSMDAGNYTIMTKQRQ